MCGDRKTVIGDIFLIPIDDTRGAVGHVVARYRATELFYMVAYEHVLASECELPLVDAVSLMPVLFVANTFDVLLAAGRWPAIGHVPPVLERFPFPYYKIVQGGAYFVESWDLKVRRPATPSEVERLDYRGGVAPIRLEKAVKAHFGVASWHPSFDRLRVEYAMERSRT